MVNLGLLLQTTSLLTIDCKCNAQFCDWPEMYLAGPTLGNNVGPATGPLPQLTTWRRHCIETAWRR